MKRIVFALMAVVCMAVSARAQDSDEDAGKNLPRMVSFRSNHINARTGPGSRYPIEWIYKQKNAPVEIIAEFELWRKIRDWDGSETWVHKAMLTNKRWIKMTKPGVANIYAKPQEDARIVAKVEDQTIGKIEKCPDQKEFCLIKFSTIEGWVNRKDFYGVYPQEVIN